VCVLKSTCGARPKPRERPAARRTEIASPRRSGRLGARASNEVVPPLRLRTLFVRTFRDGDALCASLANVSLASLGPNEEALLEQ
jgi:hypothetical protein